MKKILITGGAGFIGSHLCDFLLEKGYQVICVDNLITGDKKNIAHHLKNKNFKFIQHDVSRPLKISDKINYILHFASPASPVDYLNFPIQTLKVGALGTHNMLGLAKLKKSRFILASTSEVYGDPLISPQKEDYWGNVNPIGLRGVYDEAKRFAEAITMAYFRYHKVNTGIVRIFNTYGPRMRLNDGRVVPNFISQALKNKPLSIFGDGSQTRSFCYVEDLIKGIFVLMLSKEHTPINIGNPQELTVKEFASITHKLVGSKHKIVYRPLPQDDPKQRKPDISKANKILKWQPKISLEHGLALTIAYFREVL